MYKLQLIYTGATFVQLIFRLLLIQNEENGSI